MSARVLHLTRDFPPRTNGGISTAVGGMVRASLAAGLACAVASFDAWRPRQSATSRDAPQPMVDAAGATVLRVSTPAHLQAVHELAARWSPDVIHVHHGMLWELASQLASASRARTVFTVHVAQAAQQLLRGIVAPTQSLLAQRAAIAAADVVHAPSRAAAAALLADGDAAALAPRLQVLGLGVDDSPTAQRAASHVDRDDGLLVYAGRFADINGIGELLAALPTVLATAPHARAVLAGGLPDNRKVEARWQRRWQADAPAAVRDRLAFAGWLAPDALAALYARAGVVLVPSWFETFGLVAVEAMLHGAPIVATRAGALPELIAHDRTGLLIAPREPTELATAALALVTDRARARDLGTAAAVDARAHHLWPDVIGALARLYA